MLRARIALVAVVCLFARPLAATPPTPSQEGEFLPGVVPTVNGQPFFFVRAVPPGNVGYFLDGVRVPYLFHAFGGPLVIHPKLIERVDIHQGSYPARFGGFAGAIVSATTLEPRAEWHAEGQLRLVDASMLAEGGFDAGRGSAVVAGRHSYTAALLSQIAPDVTLDYRDFQARITYDVTSRDRVSVFAFGAHDLYVQPSADTGHANRGTEFYRVDARYDARLARGGGLCAAVTTGLDRTTVFAEEVSDVLVGTRVRLEQPLHDKLTLELGFDVQHDLYEAVGREDPYPYDPHGLHARNDVAVSSWLGVDYRPADGFAIRPAVRVDAFVSGRDKALAVDPRLQLMATPVDGVRILAALGVAHQRPAYLGLIPGRSPAGLDGGLQTALQTSTGIAVDLPWSTTALVSLFDNFYLGRTDILGLSPAFEQAEIKQTKGSSKGVDIALRRPLTDGLGVFFSYTLSQATRSDGHGYRLASFDRPHVLSAALDYDFGWGFRCGTRFSYHSGAPRLDYDDDGLVDADDREELGFVRDPAFHRLDLRLEKKWLLSERAWLSLLVEVINATVQGEVVDGDPHVPVTLPSVGLEVGL
jgi:hypothetical protein